MKRFVLVAVLSAAALAACGQKPTESPAAPAPTPSTAMAPAAPAPSMLPAASLPAGHPPMGMSNMAPAAPDIQMTQKGQVLSLIEVPQYTYLELKQGDKTRWIAATTVAVKKGDMVRFSEGTLMTNFKSKTLNRTFESITFVDRVAVDH